MKITQNNNRLIIDISERFFENMFLSCAIVFSIYAIYQYVHYSYAIHRESFQGCIGATAVGVIGFLITFERSRFEFDRGTGMLRWKRRRITAIRSGMLSFEQITFVSVKASIGSDRVNPSVRIAVHTQSEEIPLTASYSPDPGKQCEKVARQIMDFMGKGSADPVLSAVQDSARAGNMTEAIRLLRIQYDYSLEQAKDFIEKELQAGK